VEHVLSLLIHESGGIWDLLLPGPNLAVRTLSESNNLEAIHRASTIQASRWAIPRRRMNVRREATEFLAGVLVVERRGLFDPGPNSLVVSIRL
jgi:hypothetical protein